MSEHIDRLRELVASPETTRWRKAKYRPGKPFDSVDECITYCMSGGWCYSTGKCGARRPYHPGWVMSWQVRTLVIWLNQEALVRAEEVA